MNTSKDILERLLQGARGSSRENGDDPAEGFLERALGAWREAIAGSASATGPLHDRCAIAARSVAWRQSHPPQS